MTVKVLVEYISKMNIADDLDEDTLKAIGSRVKRQYEEDLTSMTDWLDAVKNGIDLMKQEYHTRSTPWEGASNYKDPILTEASLRFGDKATLELLRNKNLLSVEAIGKDKDGKKKERMKRVSDAMNFQINYAMGGWRRDQSRLFYQLPNVGTAFKKVVFDSLEDKCESIVITYPDFVVNQATKSMSDCRSFSQVMQFSRNAIEERVRSGKWLDVELFEDESTEDEKGVDRKGDKFSNEQQKVINNFDNPEKFIEQQCFYDLDGDGYEEPYVITVHEQSGKVVRIVARFDEASIMVTHEEKVMPLPKAMKISETNVVKGFGGEGMMNFLGIVKPKIKHEDFEVVRVVPFQNVTKYGFIPAPDGTFLDLGYSHVLGAMTQAINATTNQLTDRGTLNNVGGGILSKEFRKENGVTRLKMGQYVKTDVPADKLAKGIFPNPTQEPSQALLALNQQMSTRAQNFLAVADLSGQIQASTAPTTALAIIQEGMTATNALFKRIIDSQTEEFQVLYRINKTTFNPDVYKDILDDPQADPVADFDSDLVEIMPSASAEMSSRVQRIQTAALELEQVAMVLQSGGNPVPIIKGFFEAIGSDLIDKIYPDPSTMSPKDKEAIQKMTAEKEKTNQLAQLQTEILKREQDRLDKDSEAKRKEIDARILTAKVTDIESLARATKLGEEAETEATKNKIDKYSGIIDMAEKHIMTYGINPNERIQPIAPPQMAPMQAPQMPPQMAPQAPGTVPDNLQGLMNQQAQQGQPGQSDQGQPDQSQSDQGQQGQPGQ